MKNKEKNPCRMVVMMVDTQRKDMLGCYGNPKMDTEHLDSIAEEGICFHRAYDCQPVCGPARSGLFTGTYPHSNGVWANTMPLGETTLTVGQRLRDKGIEAAYIGKWHLDGGDYFGMGECPEGWNPEYWFDMRNYLEGMSEKDRRESRQHLKSLDPDLTAEFTYAHQCSDRAIEFLEKHGDEDFLLVVSYDEPHGPSVAPSKYYDQFANYDFPVKENVKDTLEGKPEHQKIWAGGKQNSDRSKVTLRNPTLFGCNAFVDDEIGRVLKKIDEKTPDALVIYTADHGDMMESHCLHSKGPAMYDEIVNIPFLVKWKGKAPEGLDSDALVSHIDLTPTILDFFDVDRSKVLEGKSMLSLFRSKEHLLDPNLSAESSTNKKGKDKSKKEHIQNSEVFLEFGRYEIDHDGFGGFQPIRCVVGRRYKLVINLMTSDELYDIKEDPGEINNLIGSNAHEKICNQLHDKILDWMNQTRDPFRGYYWEQRPWRKDAREPTWRYTGMTRQREEDEDYDPKQLDYNTGMPIKEASRKK